MSTQPKAKPSLSAVESSEEEQVAKYLKNQPDFFARHAELLAHITLPHATDGPAVSLVERQAAIMRTRNQKLDKRLRELIKVAGTNQELSDKTHKLTVKLLGTTSVSEVSRVVESALREDFGSERAALVLFFGDASESNGINTKFLANSFARRIEPDDDALKPFHTFMEGSRPRCGQIRDAQKEFLFGPDNMGVGSAALLPLGGNSELGMLAIGNQNTDHFHPAMSTDFLVRLSESISAALLRLKE